MTRFRKKKRLEATGMEWRINRVREKRGRGVWGKRDGGISRTRESREEKQVSEKLAVVDPLSSTFSSNGVECINIFGKDVIYDEHCSRGRLSDFVNRFVARNRVSLIEVYQSKTRNSLGCSSDLRLGGEERGEKERGVETWVIFRSFEKRTRKNVSRMCSLILLYELN